MNMQKRTKHFLQFRQHFVKLKSLAHFVNDAHVSTSSTDDTCNRPYSPPYLLSRDPSSPASSYMAGISDPPPVHHHLQRSHFLFYPADPPSASSAVPSSQRSSDRSDSVPLLHHSPDYNSLLPRSRSRHDQLPCTAYAARRGAISRMGAPVRPARPSILRRPQYTYDHLDPSAT